ncbi:MAG: 50S ribosomal protein L21 [candidate division WOR-3 bacterium]|nr:50S ribosomal protein L21 [candidate division WOR-3 bacterium]
MFAVIKANSHQYVVSKGDRIVIPALLGETGKEIEFNKILMIKDEKGVIVGKPYIEGAVVKGIIKNTGKLPKVIVYKFIRRENYRRKKGHRQLFTEIEITEIKK